MQRAKVGFLCPDGFATDEISTMVGVSPKTVSKWRKRFSLFGVSVLCDATRSAIVEPMTMKRSHRIIRLTTTTESKYHSMVYGRGVPVKRVSHLENFWLSLAGTCVNA